MKPTSKYLSRIFFFAAAVIFHASAYAAEESHIQLSSSVSAFVQKINVSAGDKVQPGQTLIELKADAAQHDLRAKQSIAKLTGMELNNANAQFERQQELFDIGSLSSVELDQQKLTLQKIQTAFDIANAELGKAKLKLAQHKIVSPGNAVVVSVSASVGEFVNAAVENRVLIALKPEG